MSATSSPASKRPPRAKRVRLDDLIVERGLAEDRDRARALVMARDVLVDGQVAMAPAVKVAGDASVERKQRKRFVSRGGEKLSHALDELERRAGVLVEGTRCLDVGASTGGFTDCLLQRGARSVIAVDVAYGELASKLRDDPRVEVRERMNARELEPVRPAVDFLVMDVSFISAATVLAAVAASVRVGGQLLLLVKPQFEAARDEVEDGGVVHDPVVHARCVAEVALAAIGLGLRVRGVIRSPLLGPAGNREFFLWAQA